jgi:sulfur-oxidizing protein SoxB
MPTLAARTDVAPPLPKPFKSFNPSAWRQIAGAALLIFASSVPSMVHAIGNGEHEQNGAEGGIKMTMLQMGDLHGHLIPRPNLRSDGTGGNEGGLARMYTQIKQIRDSHENVLLFNTGDTIQGSAEVLYTRGQAIINILDQFGIDGMAPGNWDYIYGKDRFLELFGPGTGNGPSGTRYGAVAANAYYTGTTKLLLPPYFVKKINGVKIGVLGLSSERAINALGSFATAGITFTGEADEVPGYVDILKNKEKVDLIVLVSEFGLGKNILIANANPDIDIVWSSDMHEETPKVVVAKSGALVSEAGQDGTQLAQLDLVFQLGQSGKKISSWKYTWHTITSSIKPDFQIAEMVLQARAEFVGPRIVPHTNPLNGTVLNTPINKVVGDTLVGLYRGNFSDELMPGVIEGTSSDLMADAYRDQAGADIGHFRGFRYGTHIRPGPIQLQDLYHYMPIGPQIGTITITGQQLKNSLETSADGSLNPDIFAWTGGWFNAYSGLRMDMDPYKPKGSRLSNVRVNRANTATWEPLNLQATYTFTGYWYAQAPQVVGGISTTGVVTVVKDSSGEALDGTKVVSNYLKTHVANPEQNRVNLLFPLPPPVYGNREIQPLLGVPVLH